MVLSREFKETVKERVVRDAAFRRELLRDYINATVGFVALAEDLGRSPKSVMRMLGPSGNPQARNLFEIVRYLQRKEGVSFHLKVQSAAYAQYELKPGPDEKKPIQVRPWKRTMKDVFYAFSACIPLD